jgi:hypothetical protein
MVTFVLLINYVLKLCSNLYNTFAFCNKQTKKARVACMSNAANLMNTTKILSVYIGKVMILLLPQLQQCLQMWGQRWSKCRI